MPPAPGSTLSVRIYAAIGGGFAFDSIFLIDGVDTNDNLFGASHGLFIEAAIAETQVLTSGISAEYGRVGGGVVNVITKSGGNAFSGTFRTKLAKPSWSEETPFEKERPATLRAAVAILRGHARRSDSARPPLVLQRQPLRELPDRPGVIGGRNTLRRGDEEQALQPEADLNTPRMAAAVTIPSDNSPCRTGVPPRRCRARAASALPLGPAGSARCGTGSTGLAFALQSAAREVDYMKLQRSHLIIFLLAGTTVATLSVSGSGHQAPAQQPTKPKEQSGNPVTIDPEALPVSLDRIQQALAHTPMLRFDETDRPVFRVQVFGERPTIEDILGPDWAEGPVKHGSLTHEEFLALVNPTDVQGYAAFSNEQGATVAATSFLLQWTLQRAIRRFNETRDEAQRAAARQEVIDALNALEQARAKAGWRRK